MTGLSKVTAAELQSQLEWLDQLDTDTQSKEDASRVEGFHYGKSLEQHALLSNSDIEIEELD